LTNDSEIIKAVFAKAEDQLVELLTQPGLTDEPVLHLAIEHGYATAINAILQVVPVSELFALADSEGKTALHSAVDSQNVEIVKMVCQAAGDRLPDLFKITDNSNYEALRYAIENGEVAIVKAMLEEIVKLPGYTIASLFFSEDGDSYTALHSAVDSKNVEIVKMICQAAGTGLSELLKITDDNGYEALHYAIDHGVAEVAKVMLEVIAKLSNDDIIQLLFFDAIEKSAIHISINHDNADILNAIIKAAGSNIIDLLNQQDSEDITPLQLAIIENKIQMLTIMLEAAGEKMSDVIYQQDLLHMAVKIGSTEAIEAIINCCPGLERQVLLEARSRPCTPLLTAAQDNNRDAVMSILSTEHIDIKKLIEREQENSHIIFKMLNASELAGIFEIQFSDQVDSSLNAVFIKDAALKKALEILQKHGINDTEKSWQSKVSSTSKKSKQEDLIHKEAEYIVSQIISPAKAHQQSDGQSRI
jgi:ankyrin repeat protein